LRNNTQLTANNAQFDELESLYKSVSHSTVVDQTVKADDQYNQVFEKLVNYVKGSSDDKKVFELVESVANSTDFKNTLLTPKVQEEKPIVTEVVKAEPTKVEEKATEIQAIIEELLENGADRLQPDTDDNNKSPENMRYLPKDIKTLKYVDEIEKEHMGNMQNDYSNAQEEAHAEEKVLKESTEGGAQNTTEKKEEKSFRKPRNNKRDKPSGEKGQETSNYQPKKSGNHKENKEDGERGHGKRADNYYKKKDFGYEVREYVPKKQSENKA